MTTHPRNRNASTRLSLNELEHLDASAQSLGLTRSQLLRDITIRHIKDFHSPESQPSLESIRDSIKELEKSNFEIKNSLKKMLAYSPKAQGDLF